LRGGRSTGRAGQRLDLARVVDRLARRVVMSKQFERLRFVLGHRHHRLIGIGDVGAGGDAAVDAEHAPSGGRDARVLDQKSAASQG
jgi:hypothetical protein